MTKASPEEESKPSVGGYVVGAVFLVFIIGGIFLAIRSGGEDGGSAHISTSSGSSNSLTADDRSGVSYVGPETEDLTTAVKSAGCLLRENLPEEGREHFDANAPEPEYGTTPPTSGNHISPPLQQADGAWLDSPIQSRVVHSLEHGRVAIQYDPDLPEEAQLELKGLYDTVYSASLLFPNSEMPFEAAATAWRSLIGCPKWQGQETLDAIRAFGVANWGKGPENVDLFPALAGPDFGS